MRRKELKVDSMGFLSIDWWRRCGGGGVVDSCRGGREGRHPCVIIIPVPLSSYSLSLGSSLMFLMGSVELVLVSRLGESYIMTYYKRTKNKEQRAGKKSGRKIK